MSSFTAAEKQVLARAAARLLLHWRADRAASDRILGSDPQRHAILIDIHVMLRILLAVPGRERRWMTTDNNAFGKSPLAYIADGSLDSLLRLQAYLSAWLWS